MSKLSIASIIGTGKFNREFDLSSINDDLDIFYSDYSKSGTPGVHMRFYENGPTVTLFRTGSCNIRGASSIEETYKNKTLTEDNLSSLSIEESISSFSITNMVFTADLKEQLDLNKLCVQLGLTQTEYEPEQFPGLVYRLDHGVALIFSSGKIVLTGFTSAEQAEKEFDKLSNELIND